MSNDKEHVRTFLAVLVPPGARQALADCILGLCRLAPEGVRWVDPQGIHLTLRFLGNIPARRVEDVLAAQRVAVEGFQPFTLQLTGLGTFPNLRRPRVLWAGVSGDTGALDQLQQSVEEQLERAGFPKDKRPFAPHLTLGRVRERASEGQRRRISEAVTSSTFEYPEPWLVDESHLIKSTLTPQGAIYTSLGAAGFSSEAH